MKIRHIILIKLNYSYLFNRPFWKQNLQYNLSHTFDTTFCLYINVPKCSHVFALDLLFVIVFSLKSERASPSNDPLSSAMSLATSLLFRSLSLAIDELFKSLSFSSKVGSPESLSVGQSNELSASDEVVFFSCVDVEKTILQLSSL